ncbi:MAG: hypothetical protein LiPW39_197 [Parcubacteria group bacterium LiPW_39]|nr:MAG: hypothetical protein LiPW39_197 [Parcubacteria group bacterium LiPW_39]
MSENKLGLNWSAVEKALAEGTFSGYKIGILETEKLFGEFLKNKQVPGRHIENKIKYIHRFLSLPDKLDYSRHHSERIIHEPHFEISREETKQAISGYWQAMLDIEEAIESLSLAEKIALRARYILGIVLKNLRHIALVVLAAAALIWFLGETTWGKKITEIAIKFNHFFIFTILFWTAIVIVSLVVIGGILYLISNRKSRF